MSSTDEQTPGDYLIRTPTAADATELGHLHVQVWREAYRELMSAEALAALNPDDRAQMWQQIAGRAADDEATYVSSNGGAGSCVRIAEHTASGELAGFIIVGGSRDDDAPTATQLFAINVLAHHHGTGVSQLLVDAALGPDRPAHLWVVEGNGRAQSFYRRNRFAPDGARTHDDELECDEIRMSRGPLERHGPDSSPADS